MTLHSEILEQPQRLADLISQESAHIQAAAAAILERDIHMVLIAARGTSHNAGKYANYLLGNHNQLPVMFAAPSLYTHYQTPPLLKNTLAIGISQSGQSPDIVSVVKNAHAQNCYSLAITNDPDSPLALAADTVLNLRAGTEKAVAATKTYTTQLLILALLSAALSADQQARAEIEKLPGWVEQVLKLDEFIAQAANRYRYMQQCVVLGRGYNFSTANEWALKMKELTYVEADAYSSADFMHGPIAMIYPGFPVMAIAPQGKVYPTMLETIAHLKQNLSAELVVISNGKEALDLAQVALPLPADIPEWLSPIPAIVAGQLFAYHLTRSKGNDTETPRSIHKVTKTE